MGEAGAWAEGRAVGMGRRRADDRAERRDRSCLSLVLTLIWVRVLASLLGSCVTSDRFQPPVGHFPHL